MRKNKVLFSVLAILLAVTCLLVSCNSEVANSAGGTEKDLTYITFGDGNSKVITATTITQAYELDDVSSLYWVYTASKADNGGVRGETNGSRVNTGTGLDGTIGPFSKGYWNFTLTGWKYKGSGTPEAATIPTTGDDWTMVFSGTANSVLLNNGTEDNPDPIDVSLGFTEGGNGTIVINAGTKFAWQGANGDGNGDVVANDTVKVYPLYRNNNNEYVNFVDNDSSVYFTLTGYSESDYYTNASQVSFVTPEGDHTIKLQITHSVPEHDDVVVFEYLDIPVRVYSGQSTLITAEMLENSLAYAKFDATAPAAASVSTLVESAAANNSVSFTSSYTPVSGSTPSTTENTTVVISGSAITAGNYRLEVKTTGGAPAQGTYVVKAGTIIVASIDLTLTKNGTQINTFGTGGNAKVSTFIGNGLNDITISRSDEIQETFTNVEIEEEDVVTSVGYYFYDISAGKLTFMTGQFH